MTTPLKHIEEASLNAWPALQQFVYDGWLLRFAYGYTNRANSINPLYAGLFDVDHKIEQCEQIYTERRLPIVYKVTPFSQPAHLDDLLAKRGYGVQSPTSVQTLDLTQIAPAIDLDVQRQPSPTPAWLAEFTRLDPRAAKNQATLEAILNNIISPACFAVLHNRERPAACGLVVQQADLVGLFDIVADVTVRRQGLATRLILDLLAWAKQKAAATAYLQVVLENEPALRLYEKLGFKEIYRYWYRVKP